jgi:SAM-dependent methyltransferase
MNDLQNYFENNPGRLINKWMHYFEIYDRYFSRYRGTDVHFLEIGTGHGGSLQMWKDYFGEKAKLFSVDINPLAKKFEDEQTRIFIGDQGDKKFLAELAEQIPRIDILFDDGGHKMEQQISTFEVLYPRVAADGVYLCEDLHTSYWKSYAGGYRKKGSFIEYSKNFIDFIHAWHSKWVKKAAPEEFTQSTYALHYYDSVLVIEKRPIQKPCARMTGIPTLPPETPVEPPWIWKTLRKLRRSVRKRFAASSLNRR